MPIISLNEKRGAVGSASANIVTGREISYNTSDKFGENIQDPYISGKFYFFGSSDTSKIGAFGSFWENSDGSESDLEIKPSGSSAFNERSTRWHTDDDQSWTSFTIDLSSVNNGRVIFYVRRQTDFRTDWDLDDVELHTKDGSTINFDPSDSSVRSNNLWKRSSASASITSYSTAKSSYSSSTAIENIPTDGSKTNGLFNFVSGAGGTSGGTGSDNAADNNNSTTYLFYEASSGGQASSNSPGPVTPFAAASGRVLWRKT